MRIVLSLLNPVLDSIFNCDDGIGDGLAESLFRHKLNVDPLAAVNSLVAVVFAKHVDRSFELSDGGDALEDFAIISSSMLVPNLTISTPLKLFESASRAAALV